MLSSDSDPMPDSPVAASRHPDTPAPQDRRYLRVADGAVEWRCQRCGHWSPFANDACDDCGHDRTTLIRPDTDAADGTKAAEQREHDHGPARRGIRSRQGVAALLATIVLAGAGHVVLRRGTAGVARMAIAVLWASAGWQWTARSGVQARPAGLVVLTGLGLLWVTSMVDVVALSRGRREPCGPRGLLWLVITVTGVLVAVVVASAAGWWPW